MLMAYSTLQSDKYMLRFVFCSQDFVFLIHYYWAMLSIWFLSKLIHDKMSMNIYVKCLTWYIHIPIVQKYSSSLHSDTYVYVDYYSYSYIMRNFKEFILSLIHNVIVPSLSFLKLLNETNAIRRNNESKSNYKKKTFFSTLITVTQLYKICENGKEIRQQFKIYE